MVSVGEILKWKEDAKNWRMWLDNNVLGVTEAEHIVARLKKLLAGQTDDFTFTGRYLRKEVLGEENEVLSED